MTSSKAENSSNSQQAAYTKYAEQSTYAKYAVGMVLLLFMAALVFWLSYQSQTLRSKYLTHLSELRVLSQQLSTNTSEAVTGNADAFARLEQARYEFQLRWDKIRVGDSEERLDPNSKYVQMNLPGINSLEEVWSEASVSADIILQGEQTVLDLHNLAANMNRVIPRLQSLYETVVDLMIQMNAPPKQIAIAQRQGLLAERIGRSINRVLRGGEGSVAAADIFGKESERFSRVLNAMRNGDPSLGLQPIANPKVQEILSKISNTFKEVGASVDQILESSPELFQVREAATIIFEDSLKLLGESTNLAEAIRGVGSGVVSNGLAVALSGLAVLVLVLMLNEANRQTRMLLETEAHIRGEEEQANQRNQQAILRLLDELGDLADGDLTIETTVTEDFTGAIADSINFTIDQLRSLVSTINETAVKVSSAAQETQNTAKHLAEASDHQAQEIAGASAAVNEMAVSIDQVSANASESSSVAERSVGIAKKGADVVRATINGMDTIREQIQETSKRIKRLGESSQEIGDIVSLINDIADQTNILALNAAIQASMAGDAGRGFAVVADEVQRLAERASASTKQIEALVKTIQNDTNEAVISMEQTTAQVVNGARLAQDAGVALGEIENVSRSLADLIQNISNAARQQAASAGQISKTMNVIQEITSQTSAGTIATATSIGHLAELAVQMRNSVAGFKLPEQQVV